MAAAAPVPILPVVAVRPAAAGRDDAIVDAVVVTDCFDAMDFVKPFGRDFFIPDLEADWAASQPAKSGSPLSSKGVDVVAGFDGGAVGFASKKLSPSSSMSPHASMTSSWKSSTSGEVTAVELVVKFVVLADGLADAVGWRDGITRRSIGGTEDGREATTGGDRTPLPFVCISPRAVVNLLVKEEIAHPAQVESLWLPTCAGA